MMAQKFDKVVACFPVKWKQVHLGMVHDGQLCLQGITMKNCATQQSEPPLARNAEFLLLYSSWFTVFVT